ncbi:hypothetical protein [Porphyromonas circumdentaria]|uniref:Uncharacterized protein n=1 Tax=Porphyromonas circumdentaria TaxID=29524 RepID=A0A1T4NPX2_9PORP|nr:hypothetical protein [Porphyromonas circumdentaria]MBB6276159.1 hypothetical protein [Porphyromonas circumdentaria]SJZ81239.1 hypothetical protein SAMN02745171_01190 [Porphyromonas circumdentaria]
MSLEDKLSQTSEKSKAHFTVPDNYFVELEQRIMESIAEDESEEVQQSVALSPSPISLWMRLRPYIGLAAAFFLTIGIFRLFNYARLSIMEERAQKKENIMAKDLSTEQITEQDYYDFLTSEYAEDIENNWLESSIYSDLD